MFGFVNKKNKENKKTQTKESIKSEKVDDIALSDIKIKEREKEIRIILEAINSP